MSDKEKKSKSAAKENADNTGKKKSGSSVAKRILKITAWVFGVIFAILLLVLIFRDSLIKFGVTKVGSWITGVEIRIDLFDTSFSKGTVHLKGLQVANPKGFDRPNMLDLEEFFFDIDVASLFTKEIVIEDIKVIGLEANAEFNRNGKFNITTLTEDLKRRFPPKEAAENEPAETPADDPESSPEPESKELKPTLLIRNIEANIKLSMIHDLSGATMPLPVSYSTTDLRIDPNEQSVPLVELLDSAAKALENFCNACFNAGALLISAGTEAGETLKLVFDSSIKSGKEVFKQSGDAIKQGSDQVIKHGKNLFESAGKLFKK